MRKITILHNCYSNELECQIPAGTVCTFIRIEKTKVCSSGIWVWVYLPEEFDYKALSFASELTDYHNTFLKSSLKYLV